MSEADNEDYQELFRMPVEMDLAKSESTGKRCVSGYASTEDVDKDKEQVLQKGIDFSYLASDGYVNWDHARRLIGGVKVPMIIGVPTNVLMKSRGLWVDSELLNGDPMASEQNRLANEAWNLGVALQKSSTGRRLAYSVEGPPPVRRGKKIVSAKVTGVALTHKPVNGACTVVMLAKSFCCGRCQPSSVDYDPLHSCSNKIVPSITDGLPQLEKALETTNPGGPVNVERRSPLQTENLYGHLTSVLYGDNACGCYDPETGMFKDGATGAIHHLTHCLGNDSQDSFKLLKRIIAGSANNAELSALVNKAGLVR